MVNLSLMEQFGIKSIQLFDKIRPDNNKNGNNEKIRRVGKLSIIIRKSFVKIKSGSAIHQSEGNFLHLTNVTKITVCFFSRKIGKKSFTESLNSFALKQKII